MSTTFQNLATNIINFDNLPLHHLYIFVFLAHTKIVPHLNSGGVTILSNYTCLKHYIYM